jgi:hypothetical protein
LKNVNNKYHESSDSESEVETGRFFIFKTSKSFFGFELIVELEIGIADEDVCVFVFLVVGV